MVQPLSSSRNMTAARQTPSALGIVAGVVAVAVLGGAVALWVHYGTAVFFEIMVAGLRSCF